MRIALAAVLALPFLACTPSHTRVPHTDGSEFVESETVALVQHDDGDYGAYCSGVWLGPETIVTAAHCVEDVADGARVEYVVRGDLLESAGDEVEAVRYATVATRDVGHDLALLRARLAPAHRSAKFAEPTIGAYVQTEGHPIGLWWSYSAGQIASIRVLDTGEGTQWYVQSTAAISPGNSGGGLFDVNGDLLGICVRYLARGENLNLYEHVKYVEELVKLEGDK